MFPFSPSKKKVKKIDTCIEKEIEKERNMDEKVRRKLLKIYMLFHLADLKISAKIRPTVVRINKVASNKIIGSSGAAWNNKLVTTDWYGTTPPIKRTKPQRTKPISLFRYILGV